jgi:hypothetical protein
MKSNKKRPEEILPDLDDIVFQELDAEDLKEINAGFARRVTPSSCCPGY